MRVTARIGKGLAEGEINLYGSSVEVCCEAVREWGYEVKPLSACRAANKKQVVSQAERDELLAAVAPPAYANGLLDRKSVV